MILANAKEGKGKLINVPNYYSTLVYCDIQRPGDVPVGLARSLEFSGLGLSVFCHVRTGFRFSLFQSLIVYKIESYHLQFRDRRG